MRLGRAFCASIRLAKVQNRNPGLGYATLLSELSHYEVPLPVVPKSGITISA